MSNALSDIYLSICDAIPYHTQDQPYSRLRLGNQPAFLVLFICPIYLSIYEACNPNPKPPNTEPTSLRLISLYC